MTRFAILCRSWTVVSIEAYTIRTADIVYICGAIKHSVSGNVASETRKSV